MAKENAAKFFELLATDEELAKKFAEADKKFAEANKVGPEEADTESFRSKAIAEVILPAAEEAGLPFTLEELAEYEEEQVALMEKTLSEDELDQVAGGNKLSQLKSHRRKNAEGGAVACVYLGVGLGIFRAKDKNKGGYMFCVVVGGTGGANAGACFITGARAR
jgi:hypothetical protein